MVDCARARSYIEWVLGDLQSASWMAEFDLIVMTGHAFQAIVSDGDLREFLAAVRRALVPGGCFAFETRNPSARAWESWAPENAVTVEGPDGAKVRIITGVITPFSGRIVTFRHTFSGEHHSPPQVSTSTLRFHDTDTLRGFLKIAGL